MTESVGSVFDARSLSALRSVGAVLPGDLIAAVITGDDVPGLSGTDYHLELGVTPREAANRGGRCSVELGCRIGMHLGVARK